MTIYFRTGPTSAPIGIWSDMASSADGTRLLAAGGICVYTSTNSGTSWTSNNLPAESWTGAASSSDGLRLVVASAGGYSPSVHGLIYTSTNSGVTWTQSTSAPNALWNSIACSADGRKLAATIYGVPQSSGIPSPGMIYTSPDSGATWNVATAPLAYWMGIASSADGTRLLAAPAQASYQASQPVCSSTNSGTNWFTNSVPAQDWTCASSSADGTRLAAAAADGLIYVSTNAGAAWTSAGTPFQQWQSLAWSANGNQLAAAATCGGIYTLQFAVAPSPPTLSITLAGSQAFLRWLTNGAAGFQLQQNTNVTTTNWTAVGTAPTVTNLSYQVAVSPTNRQAFYRLKGN